MGVGDPSTRKWDSGQTERHRLAGGNLAISKIKVVGRTKWEIWKNSQNSNVEEEDENK